MIVVKGKFQAKPDKIEDLKNLSLNMLAPSRVDRGCISYEFCESSSEKGVFFFVEEWLDRESLQNHFETEHFQEFMEYFPSLILGEPIIKIYSIESVTEL